MNGNCIPSFLSVFLSLNIHGNGFVEKDQLALFMIMIKSNHTCVTSVPYSAAHRRLAVDPDSLVLILYK